jgi:hypothetical protein
LHRIGTVAAALILPLHPSDDPAAELGPEPADRSQRLDRTALLQVKPAEAARYPKPLNVRRQQWCC